MAVINRDNPYFERLRAQRQASPAGRISPSASMRTPTCAPSASILKPDGSIVEARLFGEPVTYRVGMPGPAYRAEFARRAGGVRVRSALTSLARRRALADLTPPVGRGERTVLTVGGGASR